MKMGYQAIWNDVLSIYAHQIAPATVMILLVHVVRVLLLATSQMYHASYNDEIGQPDSLWSPFHHHYHEESDQYRWFRAEPQTNSRSTLYWTILTGMAFAMELLARFHMHAFLARSCACVYDGDRGKESHWIETWRAVHQKCSVGCMVLVFLVTVCHNKLYGETFYLLLIALVPNIQQRNNDSLEGEVVVILLELFILIYLVGPMLLVIPVYMNENDDSMTCWKAIRRAWQLASGHRCHLYVYATSVMAISELAINSFNTIAVWLLFGKSTIVASLLHGQLQHMVLAPMTCV